MELLTVLTREGVDRFAVLTRATVGTVVPLVTFDGTVFAVDSKTIPRRDLLDIAATEKKTTHFRTIHFFTNFANRLI